MPVRSREMQTDPPSRLDRAIALTLRGGAFALVLAAFLTTSPALAETRYKPSDAGHPVRIAGYLLHPVGVVYDYVILRPAWWVGSYEPFRTLFGRKD